jgi:CheY-like chemotaxis protein
MGQALSQTPGHPKHRTVLIVEDDAELRWLTATLLEESEFDAIESGNPGERLEHMPPGVQFMPKPWQPLNILIAAERARLAPGGR